MNNVEMLAALGTVYSFSSISFFESEEFLHFFCPCCHEDVFGESIGRFSRLLSHCSAFLI